MDNVVSLCLYRQKRENDKLVEYVQNRVTDRFCVRDIKIALVEWYDRDLKLKKRASL